MAGADRPTRLRRPGRTGRVLAAVAVVLVVALAGYGIVEYVGSVLGEPTLVIYSYPTLLGGVDCGGSTPFSNVFDGFGNAHHVRVEVVCPSGDLVSTLEAQANAPEADLVIGLDEITTPVAEADGLLVPYAPPELANISPGLVSELSTGDAAIPYEYGYLAIDYSSAFYNGTGGSVAQLTFPELANTSDGWAAQLLTEDPTLDLTGQEFLAWEVEYYETVLHEDWAPFWTDVRDVLPTPALSWGLAFSEFNPNATPNADRMVVSYSTDPAYAKYYNESGALNSTVSWWNGTAYGWKTIYGIGIVHGTRHPGLAQQFEDWFLSGPVQSLLPTTEWEYPANQTVPVPAEYFDASIDPTTIVPLNDRISSSALAADMPTWSDEWQQIFTALP